MKQNQVRCSNQQHSPVYLTRRPSISRWVAFSERAVDCQLGKSKSALNPGMPQRLRLYRAAGLLAL